MSTKIYLNTASCGLLLPETIQPSADFYNAMLTESSAAAEHVRDKGLPGIRETVAEFIKSPVENLAFIPNFSFGLNSLVQSLKGTERVLLYDQDYPSLLEPFRINKFPITWIDSPDGFTIETDRLKALIIEQKIELLVISHVQWLTGFTLDLQDIGTFCRNHKVWFIVDATQSLGALPVYPINQSIDVLISSNYKWMNAGFGTGIMYISDQFIATYEPVVGGFASYIPREGQMVYEPSVRSYEPGHLNMHGLLVLNAAVKHKLSIGIDSIAEHNRRLTDAFLKALPPGLALLGPLTLTNRCFIVMLRDTTGELHQHISSQGFIAIRRNGNIRISFHFHNTEAEVAKLLQVLEHVG